MCFKNLCLIDCSCVCRSELQAADLGTRRPLRTQPGALRADRPPSSIRGRDYHEAAPRGEIYCRILQSTEPESRQPEDSLRATQQQRPSSQQLSALIARRPRVTLCRDSRYAVPSHPAPGSGEAASDGGERSRPGAYVTQRPSLTSGRPSRHASAAARSGFHPVMERAPPVEGAAGDGVVVTWTAPRGGFHPTTPPDAEPSLGRWRRNAPAAVPGSCCSRSAAAI